MIDGYFLPARSAGPRLNANSTAAALARNSAGEVAPPPLPDALPEEVEVAAVAQPVSGMFADGHGVSFGGTTFGSLGGTAGVADLSPVISSVSSLPSPSLSVLSTFIFFSASTIDCASSGLTAYERTVRPRGVRRVPIPALPFS
jgi:hypothetical protein